MVCSGNYVFNFGAVFGFQQRDGVDQDRLVRDQTGGLLELRQRRAVLNEGLEPGP